MKSTRTNPAQATQPPPASRIEAYLPGSDFHDAWCVESDAFSASALDHFLNAVRRTPRWVDACMALRNRVGALVGLKDLGVLSAVPPGKAAGDFRAGERVGIFTLIENHFDEVLLGDHDKHLSVVLSVHRTALPCGQRVRVTVTTVVHVHKLLGRLYMLPVKPMHRLIVPRMLRAIGGRAAVAEPSPPANG